MYHIFCIRFVVVGGSLVFFRNMFNHNNNEIMSVRVQVQKESVSIEGRC